MNLKEKIIQYGEKKIGERRVQELWSILDDILSIADCRGNQEADRMFEYGLEKVWPLSTFEINTLHELYLELR